MQSEREQTRNSAALAIIRVLRKAVRAVTRKLHPAMAGAVDATNGQTEHATAAAISLPWYVRLFNLRVVSPVWIIASPRGCHIGG